MTKEFAIKVLTELRGYGDKFANLGFDRKEALDMAIKALEQKSYKSEARRWKRRYLDLKQRIFKLEEQQPCDDCISREEVMKLLGKEDWADTVYGVMNLSSVTPTRPKGKWVHWTDDYKDYVTCSCCGYGEEGEVLLSDKTPFCPICGADMRGDTE